VIAPGPLSSLVTPLATTEIARRGGCGIEVYEGDLSAHGLVGKKALGVEGKAAISAEGEAP
jgi:hypothetical protein